jgi:serine/threonine protein kinase
LGFPIAEFYRQETPIMSVEHFQALAKGVRLNQYEMLSILGAGGFGITYMARDTTLDTMVAIKEYLPDDFAVRQGDSTVAAKSSTSKGDFDWGLKAFLDEARVLAKFRHPNIVRVNQIFETNNTAYIVMEYAKGETLDELLKREGPLSEQQTKHILFPVLDGLKRVHAQHYLHRDIKPANIIIREEGGVVLIDFGAARQAIETKSVAITSIVTEGYAPLEQYDTKGNQGAWSDLYALGGVAYKCLTGNKPPGATSRLSNDPLVPLAIAAKYPVSKEFATAIEAALKVFANQRPQSIEEFVALMSGAAPASATPAYVDEATRMVDRDATQMAQPFSARPEIPAQPAPAARPGPAPVALAPAPASRMKLAYSGVAAAVLLVIAAGAWFTLRGANVPPPAVSEAGKLGAPVQQLTAAGPAVPAPTAAPSPAEQSPARPNVAASSSGPAAPPAAAPSPAEQSAARPKVAAGTPGPAAPPAAAPSPTEQSAAPPKVVSASQPEASRQQQAPPRPAAPPAFRPSFDCAKASNEAERLICSDSDLTKLDVRVADLYKFGLTSVVDTNEFSGEQRGWLVQRDLCTDKQCLVISYNDRIKDLQRWVRR